MAQRIPITKIRATLIPTTRRTDCTTCRSTICFGIQGPSPISFGRHTVGLHRNDDRGTGGGVAAGADEAVATPSRGPLHVEGRENEERRKSPTLR